MTILPASLAARSRKLIPWILILLPVATLIMLVSSYAVNIPFLDDWMFTPMYEKARGMHGGFNLHDFFIVQMEHRLAWPRIIIVMLDKLCPGNFVAQCWFTVFLLCVTLINIGLLLRQTGKPFSSWWPVLAFASALIFSPVQYMIILWPMMFQVATPVAGLSLGLVAVGSKLPNWAKFLIAGFGAMAATLSIASGLLVWLLMIPAIIWARGIITNRARMIFLATWIVTFGATVALYFHNLKNETDPQFAYKAGKDEVTATKGASSLLKNPGRGIEFTLEFIGGNLCRGTSGNMRVVARVVGGISLAALLAACCYWLKRRESSDRINLTPWIALGLYAPGTGMLVALGRAWATTNGDNSLQSRYVIHAVPLTVSLIALGWLIFREASPERRERFGKLRVIAATTLTVILCINWIHGRFMMETWSSSRLRAAANTQFFKLSNPENPFLFNPTSELASNQQYAERLDDLGLITPRMLTQPRLDQFDSHKRGTSSNTSNLDNIRVLKDNNSKRTLLLATGEAALPGRERVADAIIFARRNPEIDNDPWVIFHVGQVTQMPIGLSYTMGRDLRFLFLPMQEMSSGLSMFSLEIPLTALAKDEKTYVVTAYAFDFKRQRMIPMEGLFRVNTSVPSVTKISGRGNRQKNAVPDIAPDPSAEPAAAESAEAEAPPAENAVQPEIK